MTTVRPPMTTAQTPAAPPAAHGPTQPAVARARWWRRSSLVTRFTVLSLLLILGVGLLAAQVVSTQLRSTALSQEAKAVAFDASSRIEGLLRAEDLQRPLTPARMTEINHLVHDRALGFGTVGVSLWRGDRVVAYSTDPTSVGELGKNDENLEIALAGTLAQEIKSSSAVDFNLPLTDQHEVMEIYVPLRLGGSKVLGAFELYRDLSDVDERIAAVERAMFLALGGGLAVLFVALLFVVRGASRQLRRQSDELALFATRQEVNRLQTEFVGIVSHELRTPLTALLGFSELLLTENVPDSDRREWTALLHSGAQRLRHLVEQLLDVSRIDHARLELRLGQVSVVEATTEALESFAALPQGVEITQRFEPGLPPVLADHEKLVQILTNLISNAVKYSPDGGRITVGARRIGTSVRVDVTDQGLGIPPSEVDSIFDRFHRLDDERRRTIDGTGLGLYITRQLVEMHGGTVSVHSLGARRGSTFSVMLPVQEGEPKDG
jgi:signal transduction histidine kinase